MTSCGPAEVGFARAKVFAMGHGGHRKALMGGMLMHVGSKRRRVGRRRGIIDGEVGHLVESGRLGGKLDVGYWWAPMA